MGGLLLVDFHKTLLEQCDALEDDTAVHLQLCFTRTSKSHTTLSATASRTATLALKVCPQTLQAWKHIAVLGKFNLCLGLSTLCPHGEDVEDERCAVEDFHLQCLLDIAYLLGGQFVVEYHHTHLAFLVFFILYILTYLVEFTLSDIRDGRGAVETLCEAFNDDSSRRVGEKFEFIEILLGLGLVLVLGDKSHQHGSFGLCL